MTTTTPPPIKPQVPLVLQFLARFCLWVIGWRVVGSRPTSPRLVVVASPHTANMDGVLLLLTAWSVRVRLYWMVKAEMTRGRFGWLIKFMGGVGIDRSASFDMVDQMVAEFNKRETFILAIAPEGTRKKRDHWKSGFYWIAHKAQVPILCGALDYAKKTIDISYPEVHPTGDILADMEIIWDAYRGVTARYPEKVNDLRLRGIRSNENVE